MLVTHSWNALGVGYSSYFQTQKYNNVITVGSVLLATCPHWPWYFLFVILMRWDSGHWLWSHHWLVTSGEGAVDVVSEMGLSRLTYFNVINWEDHIRTLRWLVSAQARVGTPGHRGLGSGLQMWPLAESPPGRRCPWCGVWCPRVTVSLSWCLPQFLDATFTCHQPLPVTVTQCGSYPGHQEAKEPIDHWQIPELTDLSGTQPTEWRVGGCDAEIVSIPGMSIVN